MTTRSRADAGGRDLDGRGKEVPGLRGLPIVGSYFDVQRDPLGFFVRASREHGHLFTFRTAHRTWYHVSHPAYLEHILNRHYLKYPKAEFGRLLALASRSGLVTLDGPAWAEQRRVMRPAFHREHLTGLTGIVQDEVTRLVNAWERRPGDSRRVGHDEFSQLTLRVVARALFEVDLGDEADEMHRAFVVLLAHFDHRLLHPFAPPLFVPTPRNLRYRAAVRLLDRLVQAHVDRLRGRGDASDGNLLAMLLAARGDAGRSDWQVREEVISTFAAAQESTASTLFWSLYLLARHPDHQRRVLAEVDAVAEPVSQEDLARLPFTRMVIDEALRLYPPIPWLGRVPAADDEIDGFRIPAGSPVALGFYVAQRHPDFWVDPDEFNPDRFAEGASHRVRGAYLPFGLGPRICIGMHLALVEAVVAMASIVRRFRLCVDGDAEVHPEVLAALRPRAGATLRLERR